MPARNHDSCCFQVLAAALLASTLACKPTSISSTPSEAVGADGSVVLQQPATLVSNLIVLPVKINHSQPVPFILDTGASVTVIDRHQADALGLAASARPDASTGGGDVEASEIRGAALQIGDFPVPAVNVIAIDLSPLASGLGQPIGGVLGYDIFQRYVVAIDYASPAVTLHEPDLYVPPDGGEIAAITIEEQTPFINVRTLGDNAVSAPAKLEFDTGKTGSLTLVREFVRASRLQQPGRKSIPITAGALRPGQVPAMATRIAGVQLGRFTVDEVVTLIAPDRDAAGVSGETVGLLGGELLKQFTVIVDYSHFRVILYRRSADPTEFDMSGISLGAQGDDYREFVVRSVVPGSPAADAGVRSGDHLTGIGGAPAQEFRLEQIRELFRKDGKVYALELRRGMSTIRVNLRTRRLL